MYIGISCTVQGTGGEGQWWSKERTNDGCQSSTELVGTEGVATSAEMTVSWYWAGLVGLSPGPEPIISLTFPSRCVSQYLGVDDERRPLNGTI